MSEIEPIQIGRKYKILERNVIVDEITDLFVYFKNEDFSSGCLSIEEFARLTIEERMNQGER